MATRKTPAEMTRTELGMALSKLHEQFYKLEQEMHRRTIVEEYGTTNPPLAPYTVEIEVCSTLTVYAGSEKDAERVARDSVWIYDDRCGQIEYNDGHTVTIESVELADPDESEIVREARYALT